MNYPGEIEVFPGSQLYNLILDGKELVGGRRCFCASYLFGGEFLQVCLMKSGKSTRVLTAENSPKVISMPVQNS